MNIPLKPESGLSGIPSKGRAARPAQLASSSVAQATLSDLLLGVSAASGGRLVALVVPVNHSKLKIVKPAAVKGGRLIGHRIAKCASLSSQLMPFAANRAVDDMHSKGGMPINRTSVLEVIEASAVLGRLFVGDWIAVSNLAAKLVPPLTYKAVDGMCSNTGARIPIDEAVLEFIEASPARSVAFVRSGCTQRAGHPA